MQKNNKNIILVITTFIIIIAIVVMQNSFKKTETAIEGLRNNENTGLGVGNLAPDFILKDLQGNNVQLSSYRNKKVVVVNFWATWCPPCREEMPLFNDIYTKNKERLEILGVNLQESEEAINDFLSEIQVTYPLLLDSSREVKELYNIFTQPVTYFINKDGIVVDKKFGPLTEQEIKEKFGKLGIQ